MMWHELHADWPDFMLIPLFPIFATLSPPLCLVEQTIVCPAIDIVLMPYDIGWQIYDSIDDDDGK